MPVLPRLRPRASCRRSSSEYVRTGRARLVDAPARVPRPRLAPGRAHGRRRGRAGPAPGRSRDQLYLPPEARELRLGHRPRAAPRGAGRARAARPPRDAGAQRPRGDQAAARGAPRRRPRRRRRHAVVHARARGREPSSCSTSTRTRAAALGAAVDAALASPRTAVRLPLADCGPVRYACSRKVSGLRSAHIEPGSNTSMTTAVQQQLPAATWNVDTDPLDRELRGQVHGLDLPHRVRSLRGDARHDGDEPRLYGSVDPASIVVKDPNFHAHLQSPDFFDTERHPAITFESDVLPRSTATSSSSTATSRSRARRARSRAAAS